MRPRSHDGSSWRIQQNFREIFGKMRELAPLNLVISSYITAVLNKEIISAAIPSLHLNDPVSQALDLMADFHVTHLPVVAEDKLAGLVGEDDLLNVPDDN